MPRGVAILAAGASRRLGQPKQLALLDGEPLVRRAARLAEATGCEGVAVVLGYEAERVDNVLHGLRVERLANSAWPEGIASSIRSAAHWAERWSFDALMLLVSDQVRLSQEHLLQLWAAWSAEPSRLVGSSYADTIGIPAIFPRAHLGALQALRGDRGAAKLLRTGDVTQVSWPDGVHDLDTPEDLAKLNIKA